MYIEKLILHPMKLTLTFIQTPYPRKQVKETFQTTAINILTSLAGVDRMQIRLKSFEVGRRMNERTSLLLTHTLSTYSIITIPLHSLCN